MLIIIIIIKSLAMTQPTQDMIDLAALCICRRNTLPLERVWMT